MVNFGRIIFLHRFGQGKGVIAKGERIIFLRMYIRMSGICFDG